MSAEERRRSILPSKAQSFSPHCCCCSFCEHCLLNHPFCGCLCGSIFYIPSMTLIYIIWILQIPIQIIINAFAFLFCCNFCRCQCCRGVLFIADDDSIPSLHTGIMLHSAESIQELHSPKQAGNGYETMESPNQNKTSLTCHFPQKMRMRNWHLMKTKKCQIPMIKARPEFPY